MKKMLLRCCWGGCVGLLVVISMFWLGAGAWAEPIEAPDADPAIQAATQAATSADQAVAPAIDIKKLKKPEPSEVKPPAISPAPDSAAKTSVSARPVVALLDFESSTLCTGQSKAISQAIWARLNARGNLGLLPNDTTRRWLIQMDLHPFTPYHTDIKMAKVAQALRADFLVYGVVDAVANTFLLDYSVYSARQGGLVMQDAQLRRVDLDELIAEIGNVSQAIGNGIDRSLGKKPGLVGVAMAKIPKAAKAISHKKPMTKAKVRIRKANLVEKPQAPAKAAEPAKPAAKEAPAAVQTEAPRVVELKPTLRPAGEGEKPEKPGEVKVVDSEPKAATDKPEPAAETPPSPEEIALAQARKEFEAALKFPKQSKQRLAAFKRVVQIDPKNMVYQRMLIDEYFRHELYPECIETCETALDLKPGDSLLLTVQGAAHFELNQLVEARGAYEAAVAADGKNWYARYNLAQALTTLESPKAAEAWREYMAVAGEDPAQAGYVEEARRNLAELEKQG